MNQSDELRELVSTYFRSITTGDTAWVEQHVWRGAELRLIGTSLDEWYRGLDGFDRLLRETADALGGLRVETEHVEAHASGEVGWGAAILRFTNPDGRSVRARETFVFHRGDDTWKLVSSHTSVAVPDDEPFAAAQTTT